MRLIDIVGQRFGRLVVVSRAPNQADGKAAWLCRCDCGSETQTAGDNLRGGRTKSCGCLKASFFATRNATHGGKGTREYNSWQSAKGRCHITSHHAFQGYGGRGIRMSDEWRRDFAAFYRYMGPRPHGHSLDRINNDGNYEPGNCRWATRKEQANNRRRPTYMTTSVADITALLQAFEAAGGDMGAVRDAVKTVIDMSRLGTVAA